jgi:hypothetical protein
MNEILSVFNAYKKRVFNGIRTEVEASLEESYKNEADNWDALSEEEKNEWEENAEDGAGGYGTWWYHWIDSPYDGVYEYINELIDRYWSNDKVLNQTLEARVGLDPKTIYDEVEKLVFHTMKKVAGMESEPQHPMSEQLLFDFINWPVDNPKELI